MKNKKDITDKLFDDLTGWGTDEVQKILKKRFEVWVKENSCTKKETQLVQGAIWEFLGKADWWKEYIDKK